MKRIALKAVFWGILFNFAVCSLSAESWSLTSPGERLELKLYSEGDSLSFDLLRRGEAVIKDSRINLYPDALEHGVTSVSKKLKVAVGDVVSETVEFEVPRKFKTLDTEYRELIISYGDAYELVFRAYDEGVAWKWCVNGNSEKIIVDELVEFRFPFDANLWFPEEESVFTHQERNYQNLKLSEVSEEQFASTGLLLDIPTGGRIYISEANLKGYPGLFLKGNGSHDPALIGKFARFPLEFSYPRDRDVKPVKTAEFLAKVEGGAPLPWRIMLITDSDADLLKSELVYLLSDPSQIEDPSWIRPGKAVWDWWNALNLKGVDFEAGVNTQTYEYIIDFAAEHGLPYIILDEGWSPPSDVMRCVDDIDLELLVEYGKSKGVDLILWVLWNALDEKMVEAFEYWESIGIAGVKIDFMQRDDQLMVEYYHRTAQLAAEHHLLVNFHGCYKPTGLRRSYPNVITREGVKGMEHYKWSETNTNPEHEVILPFIRMVSGPMDFTPGAMRNAAKGNFAAIRHHPMSQGTRARQLAMYVVYESPLQMLADSVSHYREEPESMKFLREVPVVWDDLKVLHAKVGDQIAVARRSGDVWYVGAMTDWEERELPLSLYFLEPGIRYEMRIWKDGKNAHHNGEDLKTETMLVSKEEALEMKLAPGGGFAAVLTPSLQ